MATRTITLPIVPVARAREEPAAAPAVEPATAAPATAGPAAEPTAVAVMSVGAPLETVAVSASELALAVINGIADGKFEPAEIMAIAVAAAKAARALTELVAVPVVDAATGATKLKWRCC